MVFSTHHKVIQIAKAIAKLIQTHEDCTVDANDIIIVLAEPEKPDQSLLKLKVRINSTIRLPNQPPLFELDETEMKDLLKMIKQ